MKEVAEKVTLNAVKTPDLITGDQVTEKMFKLVTSESRTIIDSGNLSRHIIVDKELFTTLDEGSIPDIQGFSGNNIWVQGTGRVTLLLGIDENGNSLYHSSDAYWAPDFKMNIFSTTPLLKDGIVFNQKVDGRVFATGPC